MDHARAEAEKLLSEHGRRLYSLLFRLTLRAEVAEDLLQDLFCKLVEQPRFARANSPLLYAMRIASNLAFDHRRQELRRRRGLQTLQPPTELPGAGLDQLVEREQFAQMLKALDQLPPRQRDLIVMRYLEQLSLADLAAQLNKTPHQVRALCHKAIVRMRTLLNQNDFENQSGGPRK